MSYDVTIEEMKDYLRVEVSGDRVPGQEADDGIEVWRHLADVCRETGHDKLLVILHLSGHIPTTASYKIASNPDKFGWEKRFKVAVVDLNQESRLENYLTGAIAVSQGYDARIFDNELTAEAWLSKS